MKDRFVDERVAWLIEVARYSLVFLQITAWRCQAELSYLWNRLIDDFLEKYAQELCFLNFLIVQNFFVVT